MSELFSGTFEELERTERHIMILKATKEHQPVGIIRLSEITGLPKHLVRYSLRRLEQDGLIIATKDGATVSAKYGEFMDSISSRLDDIEARVEKLRRDMEP
ncbi:MAG: winged helix-turn-helix transcriptional regulator [Methanomethylophilus sp.]|jgi:predicted transcriptional regulator